MFPPVLPLLKRSCVLPLLAEYLQNERSELLSFLFLFFSFVSIFFFFISDKSKYFSCICICMQFEHEHGISLQDIGERSVLYSAVFSLIRVRLSPYFTISSPYFTISSPYFTTLSYFIHFPYFTTLLIWPFSLFHHSPYFATFFIHFPYLTILLISPLSLFHSFSFCFNRIFWQVFATNNILVGLLLEGSGKAKISKLLRILFHQVHTF